LFGLRDHLFHYRQKMTQLAGLRFYLQQTSDDRQLSFLPPLVATIRRFSYFFSGFRKANRFRGRGLRSATLPLPLLVVIKGLGLGFCNSL
ncbi:MAG: hypothetical protein ABSA57_11180, partial [Candidatus Acidiferrales bacterium]